MTSINLRVLAANAQVLLAAAPCRADLFAVTSSSPGILRIDSVTGNVTHTYPFPDWLPNPGPTALGLAFDGRVLYMNRRGSDWDELWRLDVVDNNWFPPAILDTEFPSSAPPLPLLVGLGYLPDNFGGGTLIGVTGRLADNPSSHIFQYEAIPGFHDPSFILLMNINDPIGELPPDMVARGADVDPANGDVWIAADEIVDGLLVGRRLFRTDLAGTVLETLTQMLEPFTQIRGVGFDSGAMFVAVRKSLPNALSNEIYEIDRATGVVLRSFALPGEGTVGALTGGNIIPEPSGALLATLALGSLVATSRCKKHDAKRRPGS